MHRCVQPSRHRRRRRTGRAGRLARAARARGGPCGAGARRGRRELATLLRWPRPPYRAAPVVLARAAVPALGSGVRDARPVRPLPGRVRGGADLPVETGSRCRRRSRREDGRWDARDADGRWRAAGSSSSPRASPLRRSCRTCAGRGRFAGPIRHSIDYRRPGGVRRPAGPGRRRRQLRWRDRGRTRRRRRTVSIAIRSGVVVVPREIPGIPSQYLGMLIRRLPRAIAGPIVGLATPAARCALAAVAATLDARARSTRSRSSGCICPTRSRRGTVVVRPGGASASRARVGPFRRRHGRAVRRGHHGHRVPRGDRAARRSGRRRDVRGFARRTDRVTSAEQPELLFVGHEYDASGGLVEHPARCAGRGAAARRAGRIGWPAPAGRERVPAGYQPARPGHDCGDLLAVLDGAFRRARRRPAARRTLERPRGCRRWRSGIRACVPYPRSWRSRSGLLALMTGTALSGWRRRPTWLVDATARLGRCSVIAWPYGLSMPVRYALRMWRHPEARWTSRTIPIVFHVVLAAWLFILGSFLRPPV